MILVFLMFFIRPQAKGQKKFIEDLGCGDKIVTIAGIHGTINKVNEDGTLNIEVSPGSYIKIEKSKSVWTGRLTSISRLLATRNNCIKLQIKFQIPVEILPGFEFCIFELVSCVLGLVILYFGILLSYAQDRSYRWYRQWQNPLWQKCLETLGNKCLLVLMMLPNDWWIPMKNSRPHHPHLVKLLTIKWTRQENTWPPLYSAIKKLELLNSLTHPVTIRDADEWMNRPNLALCHQRSSPSFESGAAAHLDKVIGVMPRNQSA